MAPPGASLPEPSPGGPRDEFQPVPRDGLDIRCSDDSRGLEGCYVSGPNLEVDISGFSPASRLADLLAEGYRKLGG